jgi:hypothetical protein
MIAGLVVVAPYIIFINVADPFVRRRDDTMAQCVQNEIMLLLLAGLVIQSAGGPESGSVSDILLSAVLFAVTFAVLLVLLYYAVLYIKEQGRLALWKAAQAKAAKGSFSQKKLLDDTDSTTDSIDTVELSHTAEKLEETNSEQGRK